MDYPFNPKQVALGRRMAMLLLLICGTVEIQRNLIAKTLGL
jgi:hypothetical protein